MGTRRVVCGVRWLSNVFDECTSEAAKWARYKRTLVDGHDVEVAIGGACELCWIVGMDILGCESWSKCVASSRSSLDQCALVNRLRAKFNKEKWDNSTNDLGSVQSLCGQVLELAEEVELYSEADLRSMLGTNRLARKHTAGIPSAQVQSREDPTRTQLMYAFRADDSDCFPRRAVLKSFVGVQRSASLLPSSGLQWDGHANVVLARQAAETHEPHRDLWKATKSLHAWLASQSHVKTHQDDEGDVGVASQSATATESTIKVGERHVALACTFTASPAKSVGTIVLAGTTPKGNKSDISEDKEDPKSCITYGTRKLMNPDEQRGNVGELV